MVTMSLVILCIAAEGFMLYCLFHFGQELRQESRRESAADLLWIASLKSDVMPLQFIGRTQIVVWSESAWDFLSSADAESPEAGTKGTTKEHYDLAT